MLLEFIISDANKTKYVAALWDRTWVGFCKIVGFSQCYANCWMTSRLLNNVIRCIIHIYNVIVSEFMRFTKYLNPQSLIPGLRFCYMIILLSISFCRFIRTTVDIYWNGQVRPRWSSNLLKSICRSFYQPRNTLECVNL